MPPAIIAGGIGAIGSVAGGIMGSNAADKAAKTQAEAADRASRLQYEMFQQQREDQEPWRKAGAGALTELGNADFKRDFSANDFQTDPGYQFRMDQGQKALERSAAARGGLQSGGTLKALTNYGQNVASSEYQNAYNRFNADRDRRFGRLSNIAGMGQGAVNQMGQAGQNYANNVGNNMMGAANAQGAAGIAGANAWGNTLSNLGNIGMNTVAMSQNQNWMDMQDSKQKANAVLAPQSGASGSGQSGFGGLGFSGRYF